LETRRRLGLWRIAATIVPLLAVAFGSFMVGGASVADAAGIQASLGVGCSASSVNGVPSVQLKLKVSAKAPGGTLDSVDLTVDGTSVGPYPLNPGGQTYSNNVTVPVGNVSDSYDIVWSASNVAGDDISRTALATVTVTGSRVSCRVQTT
jgi:hypothetical protein